MHKRNLIGGLLGALLLVLSVSWAGAQSAAPEDAIIARVNGESLLLSQLKEAALDQDVPPSALLFASSDSPAYRKALTQVVDETLLVQQALNEGMKPNEMDIARDVEQMLGELRQQLGSQEKLDEFLKQHHLTLTTLRTLMTTRERKRSLATDVVGKRVTVDDTVVAQFAQDRKAKKMPLEEVNLSQILVRASASERSGTLGGEIKAEAVKAARGAGGLKLDELPGYIRRYGAIAPARVGVGALGWLDPESLIAGLREQVRKMQPGEVSSPVESAEGYHVLFLLGRHTTRDLAFAAEYAKTRTRLIEQARREASVQLYDLNGSQIRLDLGDTSATLSAGK